MPRSSGNRGFGFKSRGILRILVAADPAEVLDSVEQLGFRLPDRKPINGLIELIDELHGTTEEIISTFFIELFQDLQETIGGEHGAPGEETLRLQRALEQLRARQLQFELDLQRKRKMIEARAEEVRQEIPEELR